MVKSLQKEDLGACNQSQSLVISNDSFKKIDFDLYFNEIQASKSLLPKTKNAESFGTNCTDCPCNDRPQILIVDDNIFNIITL